MIVINNKDDLYVLDLHEEAQLRSNPNIIVLKVVGGWIYIYAPPGRDAATTFVPFLQEVTSLPQSQLDKDILEFEREERH